MRIFCTLARRELAAFFCSLSGYVIIAAVTLLTGMSFVMLMRNLGNDPFTMPVTELFFNSFLFWVIVILVTPIITMRLFALEKATGTYETLMTTPVTDLAGGGRQIHHRHHFLHGHVAADAGQPVHRAVLHKSGEALDSGTLGGMYLGIFLSGCLFLSLGCFASALTRSQVVAAVISLAAGVVLFILAYLTQAVPAVEQWQTQVLLCFNLFQQMQDFTRGVADTRTVIFYVSLTFFFLFLTLRVVESRRWK